MPRPKHTRPPYLRIGRVTLRLEGDIYNARWSQHGERVQKSTKARTEAGAITYANRVNESLDRYGEFEIADISTTIRTAYQQFEAEYTGWRPVTWRVNRYFFTSRFLPAFATRKIGAIQKRHLQQWLEQQQKLPAGKNATAAELSASAYNGMITCLSALWRFAETKGWVSQNIARDIKRKREPRYMDEEANCLNESQVKLLLSTLKHSTSPHAHYIALVAVDTGMRRSELTALEWNDIDFARNQIRVDDSIDRLGTKTGQIRYVPMTTRVRQALLCRQQMALSAPGHHTPVPAESIRKALESAGKRAGIGHVHFHMLRHTAATRWYEMGIEIEKIQRALGHASIEMTRRYMKVRQDTLHAAWKRVDAAIEGNV